MRISSFRVSVTCFCFWISLVWSPAFSQVAFLPCRVLLPADCTAEFLEIVAFQRTTPRFIWSALARERKSFQQRTDPPLVKQLTRYDRYYPRGMFWQFCHAGAICKLSYAWEKKFMFGSLGMCRFVHLLALKWRMFWSESTRLLLLLLCMAVFLAVKARAFPSQSIWKQSCRVSAWLKKHAALTLIKWQVISHIYLWKPTG